MRANPNVAFGLLLLIAGFVIHWVEALRETHQARKAEGLPKDASKEEIRAALKRLPPRSDVRQKVLKLGAMFIGSGVVVVLLELVSELVR